MSKGYVQEGRIESGVQHSVQEIGPSASGTNLSVCTFNRIYTRYAWQRAADVTKQVNTMRANIVGFKQEEITQLALDSEIPALRIRRCEFPLELVIPRQRENDRQKFVAIECEWTGLLCRNTWNIVQPPVEVPPVKPFVRENQRRIAKSLWNGGFALELPNRLVNTRS